jgi:FAD/FMN-containing dehydrogenase
MKIHAHVSLSLVLLSSVFMKLFKNKAPNSGWTFLILVYLHGLKILIVGGGSVIGNTVDRGVGYTPYGDHFGMHCGFEVVLPNGEVIRTGMGAMPGQNTSHGSSNTWQLFPYGFGPYPDGLFTQSNLGIVTKMGLWLMPEPEGAQVFLFTFPREEDLETLVDIIRPLRIQQVIANFPHLRHVLQEAAVYGNKASYYTGPGAVPDDMIDEISSKLWMGKCRWLYYGCVYVCI